MPTKIRILLSLLLTLCYFPLAACRCSRPLLTDNFISADFVASVKMLSINADPDNVNYHIADVEIINLYKGDSLDQISILSRLRTSCAFLPQPESTWLIFATVSHGRLSFGYCSGSELIDAGRWRNGKNAGANHYGSVHRKLNWLEFVAARQYVPKNEHGWNIPLRSNWKEQLKGYKGSESEFAIWEYEIDRHKTIVSAKAIKNFKNRKLRRQVRRLMMGPVKVRKWRADEVPELTTFTVSLFYYSAKDNNKSFVSVDVL